MTEVWDFLRGSLMTKALAAVGPDRARLRSGSARVLSVRPGLIHRMTTYRLDLRTAEPTAAPVLDDVQRAVVELSQVPT